MRHFQPMTTTQTQQSGQAANTASALKLRGLRKSYDSTIAVDGLDLDVPAGSFFGLVGPNGAGKSQTLSMAVGLVRPDRGTVHVFGTDMWSRGIEAKRVIGVLADDLSLPQRLTGRETLTYLGLLRGLPRDLVIARADELLRVLELPEADGTLLIDYSTGMRKKLGLAVALLHNPRLLVLDEPFESVDPRSARIVQDILRRHVGFGGTVVLSSHVMATVERLCDRVALIFAGKVVLAGKVEEIAHERSLDEVFADAVSTEGLGEQDLAWLGQ